jgi:outer membrane protein OmpA-like peptidoglycan-associated protein
MKTKLLLLPLIAALTFFQFSCGSTPVPVAPEPVVEPESEPVVEPEPEPEPVVEPEPEPVVIPETPIILGASYEPEYFSPDGDGENDVLSITLTAEGGEVASWSFDILQPVLANVQGQTARVFKHFEGTGAPTEVIQWDGRSDPRGRPRSAPDAARADPAAQSAEAEPSATRIDRVMSATDYPYVFTVISDRGTVSKPLNDVIHVDVLVIKQDDGRLRVQVPSIVFRTNAADFKNLPERTITNNERVIRRIAFILNKFPNYKVQVEGHANPENKPGTKARANEEKIENAKNSLSKKRADAIVDILVDNAVDKKRLFPVGKGISEPIVEFEDTENWWKNRRVEFYLDKQ